MPWSWMVIWFVCGLVVMILFRLAHGFAAHMSSAHPDTNPFNWYSASAWAAGLGLIAALVILGIASLF